MVPAASAGSNRLFVRVGPIALSYAPPRMAPCAHEAQPKRVGAETSADAPTRSHEPATEVFAARDGCTMGVLQQFERRLEGAVEGFFARAFRSGLQPLELAKAVQRYIADNQHVSADGVVVPNVFRVAVAIKDHERLSTLGASLPRELGGVVAQTAAERGWMLRGPVKVRIDPDPAVRVGRYQLQGRVEAVDPALAASRSPQGRTPAGRPAPDRIDRTQVVSKPPTGRLRLVVRSGDGSGTMVAVTGNRMTVGRHAGCSLVIQDGTVSREHAALVRRGDDWWVVDLGSTNGTRVNGTGAAEQVVHPGDQIEFGGVTVELVEA